VNGPRIIEVYGESTPNPSALKFVTNRMLLADGVVEYLSRDEAVLSPLALVLFDFSGVRSVFITANFVTVTKEEGYDWYDLMPILREAIRGFLAAGERAFTADPLSANAGIPPPTGVSGEAIEDRIVGLLDEYVRPAVEQDGGAIRFKSFVDGVVTVQLKGSCSGCPSSAVTLKGGIENLLKKMIPEVTEVVAEDA